MKDPGQNDHLYFEEKILIHYSSIQKRITGMAQDSGLASDIVQDTMEVAWKKIETIKTYSNQKKALMTIAVNKLKYHYRKNKKIQRSASQPDELECYKPESDSAALILRKEEQQRLLLHLEMLREDYISVIMMHYYLGMSFREIADNLKVNYNTVLSWHRRALKELSDIYKKG